MANSLFNQKQPVFWPLGNIVVPTPGTPVSIMSLVDPTSKWDPSTPTSPSFPDGFTVRFQQIIFVARKVGAGPPRFAANTGNILVVVKPLQVNAVSSDSGNVIKEMVPGETFYLSSGALERNVFGPYQIFIDADTANDACQVCGIVQ